MKKSGTAAGGSGLLGLKIYYRFFSNISTFSCFFSLSSIS